MKGNYNNIAPYYDLLSHIVFGNAMMRTHAFLVNAIPANASILVIGGGTGYILEEIAKKHHSGLRITYVDISEKMIALSRKKNAGDNEVVFINRSILDTIFDQTFDVAITPFFFDNFSGDTSKVIFDKINAALTPGGVWLFADFLITSQSSLWQKLLLKLMYMFFRALCGIEASNLPDTTALFKKYKYGAVSSQTFYRQFISAVIYIRTAGSEN